MRRYPKFQLSSEKEDPEWIFANMEHMKDPGTLISVRLTVTIPWHKNKPIHSSGGMYIQLDYKKLSTFNIHDAPT